MKFIQQPLINVIFHSLVNMKITNRCVANKTYMVLVISKRCQTMKTVDGVRDAKKQKN